MFKRCLEMWVKLNLKKWLGSMQHIMCFLNLIFWVQTIYSLRENFLKQAYLKSEFQVKKTSTTFNFNTLKQCMMGGMWVSQNVI